MSEKGTKIIIYIFLMLGALIYIVKANSVYDEPFDVLFGLICTFYFFGKAFKHTIDMLLDSDGTQHGGSYNLAKRHSSDYNYDKYKPNESWRTSNPLKKDSEETIKLAESLEIQEDLEILTISEIDEK